jgi:alpha-N-acetylglucosaminidase
MKPINLLAVLFILLLGPIISNANETIDDGFEESAKGLLSRLLPEQIDNFQFKTIPQDSGRDVFEIESRNSHIVIRGNNAISMAMGLNWYLKYYCFCDVSLFGNQLSMPEKLPKVQPKIRRKSQDKYRYMLNYCSFGYTLSWYNWAQWEKLIDWMALNGINMPLAVTGQEAVWRNVMKKLDVDNVNNFLAGPPYLPFGWMGCLDGWGGPLPESWIDKHTKLQQKILSRERALGMTPVLQGFTGHVPKTIVEKFQCKVQKIEWIEWETFMLDPMDPLFQKIANLFIQEQTKLYGTNHLYAADSFIEMTPPNGEITYLNSLAKSILKGMTETDPQAVWILQGWAFMNKREFWRPAQLEAFLTAVPDENMVLLDLFCESTEMWRSTKAFYGKPWIWCNVQTFGASNHMHGPLSKNNQTLDDARNDPQRGKLCGIGFVNEGFEGNPVVYEFLTEMAWHDKKVNMTNWIQSYAKARYGLLDENTQNAWNYLHQSVYGDRFGNSIFLSTFRYPRLNFRFGIPYDQAKLASAWQEMLKSANKLNGVDTYSYDLVSVGIQVLAGYSQQLHMEMVTAFNEKNIIGFQTSAKKLLMVFQDLEKLAATRHETLLGNWLENAKGWGTTPQEKDLFEWNARRVLTLWGETTLLRDYSRRNWAGMFSGFYMPRWEMFIKAMQNSLDNNTDFDEKAVTAKIVDWELAWADKKDIYPKEPIGDCVEVSLELWEKYNNRMNPAQ